MSERKNAEKQGRWLVWTDSWWRGPALFFGVYWGMAGVLWLATHIPWLAARLSKGMVGSTLFLIVLLVWLLVAFLPPTLVVLQLMRRKWWTALTTALLSAVALLPFLQVVFFLCSFRGLRHWH
jgi:hypothetical protein